MIGVATAYTGPPRKLPRLSKLTLMDALQWRETMSQLTISINTGKLREVHYPNVLVKRYGMRVKYGVESPFPTYDRDVTIRVMKRDVQISTLEIVATIGRSY